MLFSGPVEMEVDIGVREDEMRALKPYEKLENSTYKHGLRYGS